MEPRFAMRPETGLTQRLAERFYQLVFKRDVDFPEFLMGLLMVAWGAQLAAPWETFRASATFTVLAALWPHTELGWGLIFMALGAFKLVAYFSDNIVLRIVAGLLVSSAWAFVAGSFGYMSPSGTGVVIYSGTALTSMWVFWRLVAQTVRPA